MSVLEHHHGVVAEVTKVDLGALLLHVGVLPYHQPSDLREMNMVEVSRILCIISSILHFGVSNLHFLFNLSRVGEDTFLEYLR